MSSLKKEVLEKYTFHNLRVFKSTLLLLINFILVSHIEVEAHNLTLQQRVWTELAKAKLTTRKTLHSLRLK